MVLIYISIFLLAATGLADENPIVTTSLGKIQGHFKQSYNDRTYSAFEGIPYAKPPEGTLRFEAPVAPEPWQEILIANETYTCIQIGYKTYTLVGTEDCLYLNVYVPKKLPTSSDNLDVVVHIHGGAFMGGSGGMAGPTYLMDRDIIYVNFNYRLNVFGFLSTEDNTVPGNNGLKDQVEALRWVQHNIKNFGGNPNSVTIIGLSAGGSSVHLHYFSKSSQGLFHRGLSTSGNALMSAAIQHGALEKAKKLATVLGCDSPSSQEFINCMKQKAAHQILENMHHLSSLSPNFPMALFSPVVEAQSDNAFLTDYPYNLLKTKNFSQLPWINTICEKEGILGLMMIKDEIDNVDSYWNDRAQYYMDYNYTVCKADKLYVAKELRQHYFGNKKISMDTVEEIIKIFGDRYFAHSFEMSSRKQAILSKAPVYAYIYNYSSSFAAELSKLAGMDKYYGVGHAEDGQLMYDYYGIQNLFNLTESDIFIKNELINIITSFAKTGVPSANVNWDPVTDSKDFSYLYIQSPNKIEMVTTNQVTPTLFWDNLPINENEKLNNSCAQEIDKNKNEILNILE